jgi:hypothetical protein
MGRDVLGAFAHASQTEAIAAAREANTVILHDETDLVPVML